MQSTTQISSTSNLGITLETHLMQQMSNSLHKTARLTSLLYPIALAAKHVDARIRQGALVDALGATGETNVQGEAVQKLDRIANELFLTVLQRDGRVCALASEEIESGLFWNNGGEYTLAIDPLDGSSNIDCNVSIGTIFAIHQRKSEVHEPSTVSDLLQPGSALVAAGYVMYGPSTMLVYSAGLTQGVHAFTLDPTLGEFFLSHSNIRIPTRGSYYSINEGNFNRWAPSIQRWVNSLKQDDSTKHRPYSARYTGSLVADIHRTLFKGGIFAYPGDKKSPQGKLRLLYEVNPIAFLIEASGGRATTGSERILDVQPASIHQRSPMIVGSIEDINDFERNRNEASVVET